MAKRPERLPMPGTTNEMRRMDCRGLHTPWRTRRSFRANGNVLLACLVLGCGCRHAVYDARTLPAEWVVRAEAEQSALDLGRWAAPAASSDVIQAGDVLQLSITTGRESPPPVWQLPVSDDGQIDVPQVGPVAVAGRTIPEAAQAVRQASIERRVFRRPSVVG